MKPRFTLIPSGYKDGTIYSILPNNGNGDFNFTRNSEATRINKDGLIETVGVNIPRLDYTNGSCPSLLLEPQSTNLVTYSEDLSEWSNNGGTLTPNAAVSPSGENNAYKYNTDGAYRIFRNLVTLTPSTNYTFTFYAKNIDAANAYYRVYNNTNTSDVISVTNYISQINTSTWTRIEVNFTTDASGTEYAVYLMSGDSGGDILFWGAQLEELSYATSYIPTNGTTVTRVKDRCNEGGDIDVFSGNEGSLFIDVVNFATPSGSFSPITLSDNSTNNLISFFYEADTIGISVRKNSAFIYDYDITSVTPNQRNKTLLTYKDDEFKVYFNGELKNTGTSGTAPSGMFKLNFASLNGTTNNFEGKVYDTRFYNTVLTEQEAIQLTII